MTMATEGKVAELDELFRKRMPPMFQAVFDANRDLVVRQVQVGRDAYGIATRTCAGV